MSDFCNRLCRSGCAATGRCLKLPRRTMKRKHHPKVGWADAARFLGEERRRDYDGTFELVRDYDGTFELVSAIDKPTPGV